MMYSALSIAIKPIGRMAKRHPVASAGIAVLDLRGRPFGLASEEWSHFGERS